MNTWIALLRGINVGGKHVLPMKELVRDLDSLGLENIRTYIQSGNVVFRSSRKDAARLGKAIAAQIEKRHRFRPHVLVLSAKQLETAIASNPFPKAAPGTDPRTMHYFFLDSAPTKPDTDALDATKSSSERFHIADRVFYLHAPDGIGRSKLAAQAERYLGVTATARNERTVRKILEMTKTT